MDCNGLPPYTNSIIVEIWKSFKLSSASITKDYYKNTYVILLYPLYQEMNNQYFLEAAQVDEVQKSQ